MPKCGCDAVNTDTATGFGERFRGRLLWEGTSFAGGFDSEGRCSREGLPNRFHEWLCRVRWVRAALRPPGWEGPAFRDFSEFSGSGDDECWGRQGPGRLLKPSVIRGKSGLGARPKTFIRGQHIGLSAVAPPPARHFRRNPPQTLKQLGGGACHLGRRSLPLGGAI